jgi:SAM-dependent methyltransferase
VPEARDLLQRLPAPVRGAIRRAARRIAIRRPRWGNLRRREPFSRRYGADRGTPVDRWYLERFMARHEDDIRGRVLEVADPRYSAPHRDRITELDILDVDDGNELATVVADLDDQDPLPASTYDCVIITQTMQYVRDPRVSLASLWRSLAPGGVLLLSVPALAKVDHHLAEIDRWRILPAGLRVLLTEVAPQGDLEIAAFGNLLAANAFLLGIAAEELDPAELAPEDDDYPMLSCARLRKPG